MPRIVCHQFHCRCGHVFRAVYGSSPVIMGKPTTLRSEVRCPQCNSADLSEDKPYRFRSTGQLTERTKVLIYERRNPRTGEYERFTPGRNDFPTPDPAHYGEGWTAREFRTLRELELAEHERVGKDNPHLFNEILNYDNPDTAIEHSDPGEDMSDVPEEDVGGALTPEEVPSLFAEDRG